jgi:hypothetical protein
LAKRDYPEHFGKSIREVFPTFDDYMEAVYGPRDEVGHLAVDVLGFSPSLATRHQRQKVRRQKNACGQGVARGGFACLRARAVANRLG